MAVYALTGAVAIFNAVDLSDHVQSAEIKLSAADLSTTAFGSTFAGRIPGLKDSDLSVEFNADSATSSVDATLWAIYNGGVAVTCSVRALAAATSATNPAYTASFILTDWKAVGGKAGELGMVSASFKGAGTVTRATS